MSLLLKRSFALSAAMIIAFAGSILALRRVDSLRPNATLQELLYVQSPAVIKRMSLGYDALLADIYWTRVVQYFGSHHARNAMEYRLLAPLLEITTTLDPHLIPAYTFGSVFLTEHPPAGAGEPLAAVALLQRGIQQNPGEWRLYQDLGFVYYMELHNYQAAGEAFEAASKIPGAHPFLRIMAAKTLEKGGEAETSRMLWLSLYQSSNDSIIRENAVKHLRALQVDQEVTELEGIVQLFKKKVGRLPNGFAELVADRVLDRIPRDPMGRPYQLEPNGRVQVEDYTELPFITKGLPPGQGASEFDYSKKSD